MKSFFQRVQQFVLKLIKKEYFFLGLVFFLIYLENRLFVFKGIYDCFDSCVGEQGDTYYNISIFLQRSIEIFAGNLYSLKSDHFSWFPNIIGLTSHNTAPSIVFAFFQKITNNAVLSFNLLYFGNIILTQIGVFFLVRHYSKNRWISLFLALLVPLSDATNWNFYTGHIHASLFWALPFWILFAEKYFDSKNRIWKRVYLVLLTIGCLWLFWAEWHVLIFSLFWMGIWGGYKVILNLKKFKNFWKDLIPFVFIHFAVLLSIVPLGIIYLEISHKYSAIRTVMDVSVTNWNTEGYYFLKDPLVILLKLFSFFSGRSQDSRIDTIMNQDGAFPDPFSSIVFWIGAIVLITLIYKFLKRKKVKSIYLPHLLTFLLLYIIALGPFLKIDGKIFETIKLPHFYLYKIIFPLSAIRAIWRSTAVGFLAMCAFIGGAYPTLIKRLKTIIPLKVLNWILVAVLSASLFMAWRGKRGTSFVATIPDNTLTGIADSFDGDRDFFVWRKDFDNPDYNYVTSLYNYEKSSFKLNWVGGGTIGYPQIETTLLGDFLKREAFPTDVAELLARKDVDIVILDSFAYSEEYLKSVTMSLEDLYSLVSEKGTKTYWTLNARISENAHAIAPSFSVMLSSIQKEESNIPLYINLYNNSDGIWVSDQHVTVFNVIISNENGDVVYQINEGKVRPPFLFSTWGHSYPIELKAKLAPGNYTFTCSVGETENIKDFRVLEKEDYLNRISSEGVVIFNNQQIWENKYTEERLYIPVRIKGTVESGILDNNVDISASFQNEDGVRYDGYYRDFPVWWGQPDCTLNGIYFPGDEVDFWCRQFMPADLDFKFSTISYEE